MKVHHLPPATDEKCISGKGGRVDVQARHHLEAIKREKSLRFIQAQKAPMTHCQLT